MANCTTLFLAMSLMFAVVTPLAQSLETDYSSACQLCTEIWHGDPQNDQDLGKLDAWLTVNPLDDVSYSILAGRHYNWFQNATNSSQLQNRADSLTTGPTAISRRLLLLAWITEKLRISSPGGQSSGQRQQLLAQRRLLTSELKLLTRETSYTALLNALEEKAKISDAVDNFILDEKQTVQSITDQINIIVAHYQSITPEPIAHGWFEDQRATVLCLANNMMFLRWESHKRTGRSAPWIGDALTKCLEATCSSTTTRRSACVNAFDICAQLKCNLLALYCSFDPNKGSALGRDLLSQYPKLDAGPRAEIMQMTARCYWKQTMFPEAKSLYLEALRIDPSNEQAQSGARLIESSMAPDGRDKDYQTTFVRGQRIPE
ncbi:MAG: hypothetical protein K1X53_12195 [Candidatus Sumerlaeaceae bacterium]|nr:hypothetical protein [Candidatus Sumerlaeaceae bacterium]